MPSFAYQLLKERCRMCGPGNSLEEFENEMDYALHADFETDDQDDTPDDQENNTPEEEDDACS